MLNGRELTLSDDSQSNMLPYIFACPLNETVRVAVYSRIAPLGSETSRVGRLRGRADCIRDGVTNTFIRRSETSPQD